MRSISTPLDIVALVEDDINVAVAQTMDRTTSPFLGSAELDVNLALLRHNIGLLAMRNPELLAAVAAHFDVPATGFHVLAAVDTRAHQLLDQRYAAAPTSSGPRTASVVGYDTPDPGRLAASTREQRRTPPPGGPDRGPGRTR